MHRAGQRSLSTGVFASAVLTCGAASAFHTGNTFNAAPGGGGGGGKFYAGSPRERGWTCAACHLDAPQRARVSAVSEPPELMRDGRYTPGATYAITFTLDNETLGLGSPLSNYNGFVIEAADRDGKAAGSFFGFAADEYYDPGNATLATAGRTPNQTEWSFSWRAPDSHAGPLALYVAVVDGNGANSAPTVTLTDPFGDDIAVGKIELEDAPLSTLSAPPPERHGAWGVALIAGCIQLVNALSAWFFRSRRAAAGQPPPLFPRPR